MQQALQSETYFKKAEILLRVRKYGEALEHIEEAIALNPQDTEFKVFRTYLHFFTGVADEEAAIEAIKGILDLMKTEPNIASGYLYLGHLNKEAGKAQVAVRYFEFWTLRLHGLLPDLAHCASCAKDLRSGSALCVVEGLGICGVSCAACAGDRSKRLSPSQRAFLRQARSEGPQRVTAGGADLGAGSALEMLLRGALESFAERRFRTYKHLGAAAGLTEEGRSPR